MIPGNRWDRFPLETGEISQLSVSGKNKIENARQNGFKWLSWDGCFAASAFFFFLIFSQSCWSTVGRTVVFNSNPAETAEAAWPVYSRYIDIETHRVLMMKSVCAALPWRCVFPHFPLRDLSTNGIPLQVVQTHSVRRCFFPSLLETSEAWISQ